MDKKDATPQRLVRPTAAKPKATGLTVLPKIEQLGSSPSSVTGDIVKKLSLNAAISPLNSNRPGRLPSFRGERDLTLGGSRSGLNPSAADGSGAKSKKEFKPTIPTRRNKASDSPQVKEERSTETTGRGRGKRDGAGRGRGRGRQDLIQTTGSIFGDGVSDLGLKNRTSSYGEREGGSASSLEKPRLSNQDTKVNKEEEDAALSALLRDDFIDDYELGDGFDPDMVLQPVQLPKSSLSVSIKGELSDILKVKEEPINQTVDGVTIKQEKDESKPVIAKKAETSNRRLKPSQVTAEHIFQSNEEILFIQLPDLLPSLKADKERVVVKTEPGVKNASVEPPVTDNNTGDKTAKEGVFEDIPEGRLGSLRTHKSGKLTLQIGEHLFVMDSATQVSYLQDLVSVDVNSEEKNGKMKALGPIKYKTVWLPDWDELISDS